MCDHCLGLAVYLFHTSFFSVVSCESPKLIFKMLFFFRTIVGTWDAMVRLHETHTGAGKLTTTIAPLNGTEPFTHAAHPGLGHLTSTVPPLGGVTLPGLGVAGSSGMPAANSGLLNSQDAAQSVIDNASQALTSFAKGLASTVAKASPTKSTTTTTASYTSQSLLEEIMAIPDRQ